MLLAFETDVHGHGLRVLFELGFGLAGGLDILKISDESFMVNICSHEINHGDVPGLYWYH